MKIPTMRFFISLLLYSGLLIGCQPSKVENGSSILPTYTSVESMLEDRSTTEPDTKATSAPIATATSTVEAMPSSTTTASPIPSGKVNIISEPTGAQVSLSTHDLSEQTPVDWTLPSGMYTVSLTLDGYEEWTAPITVTAASQITVTANLRQHYTVTPLTESNTIASNVQWTDEGNSLIYSLTDTQWPAHVLILPVYQTWWQYDLGSGVTQEVPPPQTQVTNTTRESLGICPFPYDESNPFPYPCDNTLQESPSHNRIAFSSGKTTGEANTWLADIDGSDIIYLENFPGAPEDVRWSSDGRWFLIGYYAGVDGSKLYYLVSADGSFVESLEGLTNTSQWFIQGATPQFSPDGQKLAFAGIKTDGESLTGEQLNEEEAYNLYILDLNTLESQLVSLRFGMFQWTRDGRGLYVLDGSANTAGNSIEYVLNDEVNYADLYFIDLSLDAYPEQKLAGDMPIDLPYSGTWTYSPEAQAIAGTFDVKGSVFGILFLSK